MLTNLLGWIDKAAAHAESKSFKPDVFLDARLVPDQFAWVRQVQSACDTAKFMASRLSGQEAPSHADDEKTMDEIRARLKSVIEYLGTFEPAALEGAGERKIKMGFLPEGKWVRGEDYVVDFALPNFYFHITTAYALLRQGGVSLGKRDYIGAVRLQDE